MIKFRNGTDRSLFLREIGKPIGSMITEEDVIALSKGRADKREMLYPKVTDCRAIGLLQTSCGNKPFNGHLINFIVGFSVDSILLRIALSSMRTHLLLETEYYSDIVTQISLEKFCDMADDLLYEAAQSVRSQIPFEQFPSTVKALLIAVANKNGLAIRLAEKYQCPVEGARAVLSGCLTEYKKEIELSFNAYLLAFNSACDILKQQVIDVEENTHHNGK